MAQMKFEKRMSMKNQLQQSLGLHTEEVDKDLPRNKSFHSRMLDEITNEQDILFWNSLIDWDSLSGENELILSKISAQEKLIHYKTPDYFFIAPVKTLPFLLQYLQPLCQKRFGKDSNKQHAFFMYYR